MLRYLPLVLKNCWRNRRRTILTVVSVGVSMCLLGVMIAVYHGLYLADPTPESALRLVTRNRISLTVPIPESYGSRIRQVSGVRDLMTLGWFNGQYKDERDSQNFFARYMVDPEKLFSLYSEFKISEDEKKAFERDRTGCVIGRDLANKHGFKLGDRITIVGDIYPGNYEFTVRGIFDSPRNSEELYFSRDYVEQSLPAGRRGQVGTFTILIDSPASAARISRQVDEIFHNSTAQTKTETEQAYIVGFVSFLGNVKVFLMGISAAVMFTILLVSANTMAMSVRERVREVGVLKTLGFTPGAVLGMILGEACALAVAGGVIGYLISIGLTSGISKSPAGMFLPAVAPFDPVVAAICVGTAALVGLVSSLAPALSASRISIVEALRSTD
jgi:putative ABC transport system permease protein